MPIRNTYLIDNKRIELFDLLLSADETEQYVTALDGAAFTRTEIAGPETAATKHFVSEMPMAALQHVPLLAKTLELLNATFAGEYAAYRAYTNLALPGDLLYSHVDCTADQRDVTALWYLCRTWHIDWAGETVFFNDLNEIALSVLPKPGRLALFDGRIRHAGRPPTRIATESRYTFAMKFQRKP